MSRGTENRLIELQPSHASSSIVSVQSPGIRVEDVPYLRCDGHTLFARIYRPMGLGPFPMLVSIHGGDGAGRAGGRTQNDALNCALATSGVIVAALDFRMPPAYPTSLQDIHFGVRWLKARALLWGGDPMRVGIAGTSCGGHNAMLLALRPSAYAAHPQGRSTMNYDGSVSCVVLCWPLIDPFGCYHHARELRMSGLPYCTDLDSFLAFLERYWPSEEAMSEGSPLSILQRREPVSTPPVFFIQGERDEAHLRAHLERFAALYRKAGGRISGEFVRNQGQAFLSRHPDAPASRLAMKKICLFVRRTLGRPANEAMEGAASVA